MFRVVLVVTSLLLICVAIVVAQEFLLEPATDSLTLSADQTSSGGIQGYRVVTTGDVTAVSTLQDDVDGNRGCVTVFGKSGAGESWIAEQVLHGSSVNEGDFFGQSLAADGGVIVVGSPGAGRFAGAAYVFLFDANEKTWREEAKLQAADSTELQNFGSAVAICGDLIVVGASFDCASVSLGGAAYVFRHGDAGWTQDTKLVAAEPITGACFGFSIAVDEITSELDGVTTTSDLVAVGASDEDGEAAHTGAVYLFRSTGESWTQEARIIASDGAANDHFGWSVSTSGNSVLVGAPLHDAGGEDAGAAYLFRQSNNTWEQETKFTASDALPSSLLGRSVALDGDRALVGAPAQCPGGRQVGAAYLYKLESGAWVQANKYASADPESALVPFGSSVSLSGTEIASSFNAESAGEAQLFGAD